MTDAGSEFDQKPLTDDELAGPIYDSFKDEVEEAIQILLERK